MERERKSQLKKASSLMSAHWIMSCVDSWNYGKNISDEERDFIVEECMKIAKRLSLDAPLNLGTIDKCIEYFKTKQDAH